MVVFRTLQLACMLAVSSMMICGTVSPPVSAAGFTDYDIALQELNKVKKVNPAKKEKSGRRKPRKIKKTPRSTTGTSAEVPAVSPSPGPEQVGTDRPVPIPAEAAAGVEKPQLSVDASGIAHDPFSYGVTGKRTLLKAVVNSTENVAAVFCRIRSVKGDAWARVPMTKVENTHFTYQAVLPALAPDAQVLRYSFVVVDLQGKETISREFTMPLKQSLVVPGWQQDPSSAPLGMVLENSSRPLDGYNDPGILPLTP